MSRRKLEDLIEAYLSALVRHAPDAAPLAAGARYTENTVELAIGRGLWRTISARGDYSLCVCDPETDQAVFFGSIEENGAAAILALRLRAQGPRIREVEALVARRPGAARMGTPHHAFSDVVAPHRRESRAQLVAHVDRYFDAIETSNPEGLDFDPLCNRRENGMQSTNNPDRTEHFRAASFHGYALGCREQFATGMWSFIERVRPRRYAAVDVEKGLVAGFFTFMHPGVVTSFVAPTGERIATPDYALAPSTFEIAEVFKLDGSQFRQIEAIGVMLPYGAQSGW